MSRVYCTANGAHVYSAQKEALLVAFYRKLGIPSDGYAGCVECGLTKLRRAYPKMVAEIEALAPS